MYAELIDTKYELASRVLWYLNWLLSLHWLLSSRVLVSIVVVVFVSHDPDDHSSLHKIWSVICCIWFVTKIIKRQNPLPPNHISHRRIVVWIYIRGKECRWMEVEHSSKGEGGQYQHRHPMPFNLGWRRLRMNASHRPVTAREATARVDGRARGGFVWWVGVFKLRSWGREIASGHGRSLITQIRLW